MSEVPLYGVEEKRTYSLDFALRQVVSLTLDPPDFALANRLHDFEPAIGR